MIIDTCVLILTLCEYIMFYHEIFGDDIKVKQKRNILITSVLIILLSFGLYTVQNKVNFIGVFLPFTVIILYPILNSVDIKKTIKQFIISFPILSIIESLIGILIKIGNINNPTNLATVVITIITIFLYGKLFGHKIDKNYLVIHGKLYFALVSMLYIFVVFITFFLYVINRIVPQPKVKIIGVIVIMIGGVTIIVLAMNTIYMINLHIHNKLNLNYSRQSRESG